MLFKVGKNEFEVPVEQVNAGLTAYDEWIKGKIAADKKIEIPRAERLLKVSEIAALIAPRQYIKEDKLKFDYFAPERLKRVILSELGKRAQRKRHNLPLFGG